MEGAEVYRVPVRQDAPGSPFLAMIRRHDDHRSLEIPPATEDVEQPPDLVIQVEERGIVEGPGGFDSVAFLRVQSHDVIDRRLVRSQEKALVACWRHIRVMRVVVVQEGEPIEGDLRRCRAVSVEKQVDQQGLDLGCLIADLVVARGLRPAQFQPVERRFAGQRRAIRALGFEFPAEHGHHRVMTQLVVIDQVLVAQRNPEHPLPDHPRHRVLDQFGRAVIAEAAGKPLDQPDLPVGGAQQNRPGLRGHPAAVKPGHHRAPLNRCKSEQIRATLRLHRVPPASETSRSCNTIFSDPRPRCTSPLRNAG